MDELAKSLAEEMVQLGLGDDVQTIANYIADNSDWEGALDLAVSERGNYLTEAVMDDFISDVQFYMEELKGGE